MNEDKNQKEKTKALLLRVARALFVGLIEGGVSAGITFLIVKINYLAVLSVVIIWLVFGWLSTYLIEIDTLQILLQLLSACALSAGILYLVKMRLWLISLIIGLSAISWSIGYITKILIFPKKAQKFDEEIPTTATQKTSVETSTTKGTKKRNNEK